MRKLLTLFAVLCATAFPAQFAQAQHTSKVKIGFSFEAMKGERWQTDLVSFETRAKQLGAEVVSSDAKGPSSHSMHRAQLVAVEIAQIGQVHLACRSFALPRRVFTSRRAGGEAGGVPCVGLLR